jgi:glycosyltransferase involved in cell wall biosynthesis
MSIRIAFFSPWLTTGGTQRHLQQVLSLLDRRRFAASVYTIRPGGEVEGELRAAGVPVVSLDAGTSLTSPRAAVTIVRAARMLRAAAVDVVHGYQWRPALVGTLAARLAGVPVVFASKRSLTGDDRAARFAWRMIGRRVDTMLANADALRVEAETHGVAGRWVIVPSGIDVERFGTPPPAADAKAALGLDPTRPVVGTVGRLEARKGHDHFLAAAQVMLARANGLRPQVLIVGDGPLRAQLAARAAQLGVAASVTFTGALTDVRGALGAMDVFVLPSHAEGMSNALLEAMAAARPVVATAVGGTREAFDGDRTGVLVPAGDADALAGEVLRLLGDAAGARRMGAAAQSWVAARFGARAMVDRMERLYEERLSQIRRSAA